MLKKVAIIISPNYGDYARKYLAECADSLKKQDYAGEMKIFITDNESTEESYRYVESVLNPPDPPLEGGWFEIIRNKNNDGFAKGNNDAIKKALEQGFQYIILFNMDTVLEKDCVSQMIKAIDDEKIFLDSRLRGNDKEKMDTVLEKDCVSQMIKAMGDEKIFLDSRFRGNDKEKMDTVLERDCVSQMIKAMGDEKIFLDSRLRGNDKEKSGNDKKEIGAVQARLMLYKDNLTPASPYKGEGTINSLGNETHFLGFGYSRGYGEEYAEEMTNDKCQMTKKICYPSGAAVLFKAEVLKKIGLFDEEFWLYNEDQDLGWRIWLAGFSCILAPRAVVYHKYQFNRSIKKYYFMDRNRIIAMLKNYHWLTLAMIFPAFLFMEIGLIFFAFKGGWLREKIKVYKYFLSLKSWRYIRQARKQAQSLRRVKDKEIIKLFSGRIWYQEIGDRRLKIANAIFGAYWRVVKVLIVW